MRDAGTAAAGVIAANRNNAEGISGINTNTKLLTVPYLTLDFDRSTNRVRTIFGFSELLEGMNYVLSMKRDHDVNIRVMLIEDMPFSFFPEFQEVIPALGENGVLMVWSYTASNNNNTYVIQTIPTDRNDEPEGGSQDDSSEIDLAAPGLGIVTTDVQVVNDFDFLGTYRSNTSSFMSAAHVAGAAALLFDHNPELQPLGLKSLLKQTGDSLATLDNFTNSGKRLNVNNALNCQFGNPVAELINAPEDKFKIIPDIPILLEYAIHDCGLPVANATITATTSDGALDISLFDNGLDGDRIANDGIYTAIWLPQTSTEAITLTIAISSPIQASQTRRSVVFDDFSAVDIKLDELCLLYTSPSPRDQRGSRMPSSA